MKNLIKVITIFLFSISQHHTYAQDSYCEYGRHEITVDEIVEIEDKQQLKELSRRQTLSGFRINAGAALSLYDADLNFNARLSALGSIMANDSFGFSLGAEWRIGGPGGLGFQFYPGLQIAGISGDQLQFCNISPVFTPSHNGGHVDGIDFQGLRVAIALINKNTLSGGSFFYQVHLNEHHFGVVYVLGPLKTN